MTTHDTGKKQGLLGAIWETVADAESCCAPGETCCGPASPTESNRGKAMETLTIFDAPMCCSTGVCGPEVDRR